METLKYAKEQNELEKRIGYSYKDQSLLTMALTHSSFANERGRGNHRDYERLEFLGDAVLELVSSDYLYHKHEDLPEGKLTKLRASMVCEPALAKCARNIGLEEYILLGKGEEMTGGRDRDSIISDVMEAIIGAMYLDGGLNKAKEFIYDFVLDELAEGKSILDSKTVLQEMVQADGYESFEYRMIGEKGPDHNKTFMAEAVLNGEVIGYGEGRTKKAAQQAAAALAIVRLRGDENGI